ncbi:MAG: hypothetical protein EP329_01840 [Deltaproteobacteria bacterium]|nr:MAG: hypothetical protein EP329_01840 [Deltaproteobacteria bacterium]
MTTSTTDTSRRRTRRLGLVLGAVALAGLATVAATAMARPPAAHRFVHDHDNIDPSVARQRAERIADRVVDKLDGTEAQRAQLRGILVGRVSEVLSLRAEGQALRERLFEALMRTPRPDRAEVEALRVEALGLADRASQVLVETFFEASEVLTDAQLAQVRDRLSWLYD